MTSLILTAAFAATLRAQVAIPKSYKDLKYPALNPVRLPKIERFTLANGMRVMLVEDHELPMFAARAYIPGGEHRDPAARLGLADVTLSAMRSGGSKTRSGDDLDKELDNLPASVETAAEDDANSASISCLAEHSARMLAVLADLLGNPAFPQDKIDLAKTQIRAGIERRNDDTMGILYREMAKLMYGKDSPYARHEEYATVDAITRNDVLDYYKENFQPDNMILAAWGDFDSAAMRKLIESNFGQWPKGGKSKPATPPVDLARQAKGVFTADKSDVAQSWIQIAHLLDMKRDHPDYPAMVVANQVLGGGFGSRLFDTIRTKEGLAYAASAGFTPQYAHAGVWRAMIGVENRNVSRAVEAAKREIRRMRETEITDDELQRAKDGFLKGDAFNYDSVGKIVGRQMVYDYYGYPPDQLERTNKAIAVVTRADVLRVAKKYIDESKFAMLVVGKASEFKPQLSSGGPVIELDISIPQPKMEAASPATGETEAKARALLAKARQAHGGAALDKVSAYATKAEMVMVTPQGEFPVKGEGLVSLEGKSRMSMATPGGEMVQVFDGTSIFMKAPGGAPAQQMPAQFVQEARATSMRETIVLLRSWDKPGFKVQALGSAKVDGKDAEGVLVSNEAARFQVKVYVDPQTGTLLGKSYVGQGGEMMETLYDLRDVDGVRLPFRTVRTAGGKKASETRIQEYRINPGLPGNAFNKPE
jgi:predicted Zn-dependent peptidase